MNTLDLQALGLEEMNEMQMYDVEGGIWWLLLEVAYEVIYSQDDIKKGYAAGKKFFN